uniref:Uncharacterized protein n=1 Tax=Rhizophora mucronata TaxID=61149 RepID=A0A2P2ITS0_RHIMU
MQFIYDPLFQVELHTSKPITTLVTIFKMEKPNAHQVSSISDYILTL